MKDYSELKRLAEAAKRSGEENGERWPIQGDWFDFSRGPEIEYVCSASPAAVLSLIAEVERHQSLYDHMKSMREAYGYGSWTEVLTVAEKLKAENEALRKALTVILENSDDLGACECAADALIDSRKEQK